MKKEKLENSQMKFSFDIKKEDFEKALDKAFEKAKKNVSVKGFRKGSVPRNVFEKQYGIESLYDDAVNELFKEKAEELIKAGECKEMCSDFMIDIEGIDGKFERGKDFILVLSFDTYPEFKDPEYKGIEVKKKELEVTEKEVEDSINQLLKNKSKLEVKESGIIEKNNVANFDFKGYVDDVAFDGGEAKGYELEIGSNAFIPGFEDQMIGMKKGETKDIMVKFPEDYHAENLKGKDAKFVVTINEVKEELLPKLDDEFVKELKIDGVNTVKELKEYKEKEIKDFKDKQEEDRIVNDIFEKLIESTDIKLPKSLIDRRVKEIEKQYENYAKMYNIPLDTFIQMMGVSKEDFDKRNNDEALKQAKFTLIASRILTLENIEANKDEIIEKIMSTNNCSKEEALSKFKDLEGSIVNQLLHEKLVNLLKTNAKYI